MIRLGIKKEVSKYFEAPAVSQSFLKRLGKGVAFTKEDEQSLYYTEKGHLVIGSAVDDRISMGLVQFNKDYYVSERVKPSDAIMSIIQMVFDKILEEGEPAFVTLHGYTEHVQFALEFHKYQERWKLETRINKIMELGYDYFEQLKESHGKQILSAIESMIIGNIEMSWRTHIHTSKYFVASPTISIFYQVPVYFSCDNVDCRALLDMVIYDNATNTLQPIDFKTMAGNTTEFVSSALKFGYNFQGAFYTEALKQLVAIPEETTSIPELEWLINVDTVVLPFKFMVETTGFKENKMTGEVNYYQGNPLMYTLSEDQIRLGKYGRPELFYSTHDIEGNPSGHELQSRAILGFKDTLKLAVWHTMNGFEVDKNVVESGGDILI